MTSTISQTLKNDDMNLLSSLDPSIDISSKLQLSDKDTLTIQLLEKLEQYTAKHEDVSKDMTNSTMDLKRANYAIVGGGNGRFGRDSWDLRCCLASKSLNVKDGKVIGLVDGLSQLKEKQRLEKKLKEENKEKGKQEGEVEKGKQVQDVKNEGGLAKDVQVNQSSATSRKTKGSKNFQSSKRNNKNSRISEGEEVPEMIMRDPIRMFSGGFVPPALKSSKKYIDLAIEDIVQLANYRRELLNLVDELERLEGSDN
ncbi:unnamed protein product [Ambrosiozyma monospora]|uniref:Vacuolar ATPase assembly protein VMA22 n=1 Tax=Ambrosiozyma monospora TaxID=43982 RepID=A0A9W6YXH3_AMBMO|nr:unnamed protein product [Ambrosiozyma monospora]